MAKSVTESQAFAYFVEKTYDERLKGRNEDQLIPATVTQECCEQWMAMSAAEKRRLADSASSEGTHYELRRLAYEASRNLVIEDRKSAVSIFFYVPNLIGYLRILLLLPCVFVNDGDFLLLTYTISVALDYFDGYFARSLQQSSAFGAWLDVVIDNFGRGILWQRAAKYGYLVSACEWLTFVSLHSAGANWKREAAVQQTIRPPWLIRRLTANEFRNPVGMFAIGSVHLFPIVFYCRTHAETLWLLLPLNALLPFDLMAIGTVVFACGRLLAFACECWMNYVHIRVLAASK